MALVWREVQSLDLDFAKFRGFVVDPRKLIFVKTNLIRLNLEIQLTIKISEKTEQRRFGVILAPFSS